MHKSRFARIVILLLVAFLLLAACRREEEPPPTPTLAPTAVVTGAEEEAAPPTTAETPADETSEPAGPAEEAVETLPILAPVDPEDIDWPPQIVYSSPLPGEEVMLDGAITIRFDQPMDQESVESAFQIEPVSTDNETVTVAAEPVSGDFSWPEPNTLIYTPAESLAREQQYQVRIGTEAAGRNGKMLAQPVSLQFETVGFLEVAQTAPSDGAGGVAPDGSVTVFFNRPVVPLVTTGQQADLPDPLQFEPEVAGSGEWVATSMYRFTPTESFAGATEYTVTIPAGLEDVTGGVLEEDYTFSFQTAAPSVRSIEPASGAELVPPTAVMTLTFNMPMDQASAEAAISLSPAVPLTFSWSEDAETVIATPERNLELGTRYTLRVAPTAQSLNGEATLDGEASSFFDTVPFPAVVSTMPADGEEAQPWQYGINIEFAGPMDPDTVEDRIQITPEPERVNYFLGVDARYTYLEFALERNTDYTVTVPGDVADPYGNTLGRPYTFQFTTSGLSPLVSLNLPNQRAQLSTSYPTDVTIIYRNVDTVDVTLYDIGLDGDLISEPYRLNEYTPDAQPIFAESFEVNPARDEAQTLTVPLAGGGVLPTGIYYLRASSPQVDQDTLYWQNQRVILIVADTNIVVKEMPEEVHVWATELETGEPAADLDVTLYARNGARLSAATTDERGFASFRYEPLQPYLEGVTVVAGTQGQPGFGVASSMWNNGVNPWEFGVNANTSVALPEYTYIYTDRPIYRPGDTVYFKGILRDFDYGRYDLPSTESVLVKVEHFSFFEGPVELEYEETLTLDEFGTYDGEFTLPEDARLGTYRLYLSGSGSNDIDYAYREFQVAEYRTPEFQVTVTPAQEEALRGETVDVTVEARYFFGAPASDLPVTYNVYQRGYAFSSEGEFYSFTNDDTFYYLYDPSFSGGFGEQVLSGQGRTDAEGRFTVTLPGDLLEDADEGSRLITVEATVSDLSEFPVAATGEVVMHAATTYVGIRSADSLATAGDEATVELISVDWDGEPVSGQEVEVVFYERTYDYSQVRRFGMIEYEFIPTDTEIARTTVTTDAEGEATASFVPEIGGTYRAVASVTDASGRTHRSNTFFWVAAENFAGWRNYERDRRMDLVPDMPEYEVGDTARILVQSPFEGTVNAWLTIERGNLLDQELITLEGTSDTVEIPIGADMAPNAYVSITVIKGIDETNQYADIRMGLVELRVNPERLLLNIDMTPQTDQLQPGETVSYDIRATDYAGNGVQTSLSLALVDLAVLTLVPDNARPIDEAFYSPEPYRTQTGSGLFISGEGLEVEVPEEQLGGFGGGGDGAFAESAVLQEEDDDVRRDFPDTAFWEATLVTDAEGRATAQIPLPDSVTTWRLSSKGVTVETLVGQDSVDVVATLPLLIRPVTPRFFTVDDRLQIGAIINNNTSSAIDATVSLETTGLVLEGEATQEVSVPVNGQQLVRWPVVVEDVSFADLTFRAEGGGFRDATKPTFGFGPDQILPVYRYDARDLVGTSGVLEEAGQQVDAIVLPDYVDPRRGSINTQLEPSLAAAIFSALDVAEEVNLENACAHSVVSFLVPNVATALAMDAAAMEDAGMRAILDGQVERAIERLAQLQISNSGWGFCESDEVDEYLTAYALFGLAKAEEAGYDVSAVDTGSALRQLDIRNPARFSSSYDANRQAFFLYVQALWDAADVGDLDALFDEHRDLLDPYAQAYLALAYDLAGAGDSENVETLLSDLSSSAIVSATGAHWEDVTQDVRNLSSNIRGTAVVIDALAQLDPENPLAAQAVRWLMSSRRAVTWPTEFETAWSIYALTDYVVATGELEADYEFGFAVNGVTLESGQFDAGNLTETVDVSVALDRLSEGEPAYLAVQRGEGPGRLYYTTHLDAYLAAEDVEPVERGVRVERVYYDAACDPEAETCAPIEEIAAGQEVRVQLTIIVPNDLAYVVVEDPIPAGAEALNPNLLITGSEFQAGVERGNEPAPFGYWGWWFFNNIQFQDEKVVFVSNYLPAGTYQYTYYLQPTIPGEYQVMPAVAYQEFLPEVFGRSAGKLFIINE